MRPIVKTLLWIAVAAMPLVLASFALVIWDRDRQEAAAHDEAVRNARAVARVVDLTLGGAARKLEAFGDARLLERAIAEEDSDAILGALGLFRYDPAWLGLVAVGPDGESLGSIGAEFSGDRERAPEAGGIALVSRSGLEPPRALITVPVVEEGVEVAWLLGAYSLRDLETVLGHPEDAGLTALVLVPSGAVLLGPPMMTTERIVFEPGVTSWARVNGQEVALALEPVLDGSAAVASLQRPEIFAGQVQVAVIALLLTLVVVVGGVVGWRVRLQRIEGRLLVRERELEALHETATDASASTSVDHALRMAGARAAQLVAGVDEAAVALWTPEGAEVDVHPTYPVPRQPIRLRIDDNPLLSRSLHHGRREMGPAAGNGAAWGEAGFEGDRWACWTPLVAHGRVLGALAIRWPRKREALRAEEQRLLDGLAATLAVAVESHERTTELAHQRTMLATVVEASPDGLLALDAENRVLLDNPAARHLLRADRSLVGQELDHVLERVWHAGGRIDFDFDPQRLLEKSRAGSTTRGSLRVHFDGEGIAMESMMAPLSLPHGGAGSLVSLRDVSERAELEQVRQLHQQVTQMAREASRRAALLEHVLTAGDVGLAFLDREGRVVFANQLFGDLLGMLPPSPGTGVEQLEEAVHRQVTEEMIDLTHPMLLHTATNPRRILTLRSVDVRDENEQSVGRLVSLRDETAQRELDEARESFIGVAAHELKNPLAVLRIQAEVGLRNPARSQESLQRILDRSRQLGELVDRLLDATRAELGKLPLHLQEVELRPLVDEAVEPWLAQGAALRVLGGEGTKLEADPIRLRQVVSNLVSNAVRYGAGQPIEVRVEGNGREVTIAVQDRGPGIAPEEQLRIFERFGQTRSAAAGPGLGIGLYLANKIAQAHGGRIDLESSLGQGSTFTVVLPAHPGGAEG